MIRSKDAYTASDPARTGLLPARDGMMWLDDRYQTELEAAGLTDFDAVMSTSDGQCLRVLPDRENRHLPLRHPRHPARGAYLKRHRVRTWGSRLRATLGGGPGETAGRVEARNIRRLAADGVASMDLVAYGERLRPDGRLESFLLTEELEGFEPLDDFLKRRFRPRGALGPAARDRDLDRLIRNVAAVARALHGAGYNHRDLYCCHFFVREPAKGAFEVRLIDLQRVEHRRRFRRRWLVKDLAQLGYSAPGAWIGTSHRLAFFRHYLGVERLRRSDKRLIRAVLAKQRRIARREGPAG